MLRLATTVDIKTPVNRLVGAYGLPPIPCMEPVYPFGAGEPHVGGVLNAFLQPPGPYGMRFKPRVVTVVLQREFRWRGTLLFSRLFQGEHFFLLEPVSPQSTRLVHGEISTGLLVPLLRRQLEGPTLRGFHAMNEVLKSEAEQS